MKVNLNFGGFKISSMGMGIQRKKMDLIAENIANMETTKTEKGDVYQRKYLEIHTEKGRVLGAVENSTLQMKATEANHLVKLEFSNSLGVSEPKVEMKTLEDTAPGQMIYMPDHPDANSEGYVVMPNVNVVTEMVDMIAATRGYEANVTAFNASKEIAKNSLDI